MCVDFVVSRYVYSGLHGEKERENEQRVTLSETKRGGQRIFILVGRAYFVNRLGHLSLVFVVILLCCSELPHISTFLWHPPPKIIRADDISILYAAFS